MTEEELLILVVEADDNKLAEAVAGLSEKDRATLFPAFETFRKVWARRNRLRSLKEQFTKPYAWLLPHAQKAREREKSDTCAWLAVFALGSLPAVKRLDIEWTLDRHYPPLIKVLDDRRPDWADAWLDYLFTLRRDGVNHCFALTWPLIERGICRKPDSEGFRLAMAQKLCVGRSWGDWPGTGDDQRLSNFLRNHPVLHEDVYALFDQQTDGFMDDLGQWETTGPRESWAVALRKLSEEGVFDRERLLAKSLEALHSDFKTNLLNGIANFHEGMEPTPKELRQFQDTYLGLLSASTDRPVAFALRMVKRLEDAGILDESAFIPSALPVFSFKQKGLARDILERYSRIGARNPALLPEIMAAVAEGTLGHQSSDVQAAGLKFLEARAEAVDPPTRALIAERLGDLPATLRPRAEALLGSGEKDMRGRTTKATPKPRTEKKSKTPPTESGSGGIEKRARSLPAAWQALAGVDAALKANKDGVAPPPLAFEPMDLPLLSGRNTVVPIASADELLDAAARALEATESALEYERILDGISRLGLERPDGFAERAAPMLDRVRKLRENLGRPDGITFPDGGPRNVEEFLAVWLGGPDCTVGGLHRMEEGDKGPRPRDFQERRIEEIQNRLKEGSVSLLLSLPTHDGGWIAPAVLVERIQQLRKAKREPGKYDLIQALLRLAPDGRDGAKKALGTGKDECSRALRWALGGNPAPDFKKDDPDIWIAAGRARSPRGELAELNGFGLKDAGPDGIVPSRYQWNAAAGEHQGIGWSEQIRRMIVPNMNPRPGQDKAAGARPTVLAHRMIDGWGPYATWHIQLSQITWPASLKAHLGMGLASMVRRIENKASKESPFSTYFEPLYDADVPFDETAVLAIVVGLSGKDEDVALAAKDALIAAISDGRVVPASLYGAIEVVAPAYWFKVNRITPRLAEIGSASPLHAWVAARVLEHLVRSCRDLAKDGNHIFAALLELLVEHGLGLEASTADALGTVKGSGKSARLAKQLLDLKAKEGCMEVVYDAVLQARVARAERWAFSADS